MERCPGSVESASGATSHLVQASAPQTIPGRAGYSAPDTGTGGRNPSAAAATPLPLGMKNEEGEAAGPEDGTTVFFLLQNSAVREYNIPYFENLTVSHYKI